MTTVERLRQLIEDLETLGMPRRQVEYFKVRLQTIQEAMANLPEAQEDEPKKEAAPKVKPEAKKQKEELAPWK